MVVWSVKRSAESFVERKVQDWTVAEILLAAEFGHCHNNVTKQPMLKWCMQGLRRGYGSEDSMLRSLHQIWDHQRLRAASFEHYKYYQGCCFRHWWEISGQSWEEDLEELRFEQETLGHSG